MNQIKTFICNDLRPSEIKDFDHMVNRYLERLDDEGDTVVNITSDLDKYHYIISIVSDDGSEL